KAGTTAEAVVTLTIAPGWHINANPPSPDLIPTTLTVKPGAGTTSGSALYPPAHEEKLSFSDEAVRVYDGTVSIRMPIAIAASAPNGRQTLKGTLAFQSCNNQVCLPPARLPFTVEVMVTGGGAAPAPA